MRIQVWINWAYIFTHVVGLLQERGLAVEATDEKKMFVVGRMTDLKRIWEVQGVEIYMELKDGQVPSDADLGRRRSSKPRWWYSL